VSGDVDPNRGRGGQFGTTGGNNHQIEWRPDGRQLNAVQNSRIAVQILQEVTAGAHLTCSRIPPQERRPGAVVRRGNRDESLYAFQTTQPLKIVTCHEPAHAEAHQIDKPAGRNSGTNISGKLVREFVDPGVSIVGDEVQRMHLQPFALKPGNHMTEQPVCVVDPVD
jgi:hypothetical protein